MMNNIFDLSDEDVSVSSLYDLNLQEPNRSLYIAVILQSYI